MKTTLALLLAVTATATAALNVEEQDVGPVASDAQYVVSEHGGHVAAAGHKGSRFAVTVDGVAGPKFDEIRTVSDYIDPRGVDQTQSRSRIKPVIFSKDGSRYAYIGRQGNEFVLIADGKELLRTSVENPNQLDVHMQFAGDDGKHLLFAISGYAGFTLWVDGQKMPGTYNSGGGGTEGITDPLISPDGTHYVYVAQIAPGKRTVIIDGKDAGFVGDNLAFTADGHHLLALVRQGAVVWLAVDGKPRMKTDGISQLVMAPEGNGFAAVLERLNPPGEFLVVNAKKVEGSDCQSIKSVVISPDGKRYAALCSASPSVKFVLADGKKGQEYFDVPMIASTIFASSPMIAFSPDSSKLGYAAQAANKFYVVINDDESDGFDSNPGFVFSADGKHVAYGGIVRQPYSTPIIVDGKPDPLIQGTLMTSFAFSPDGSRHAVTGGGAVCVDGKSSGIVGGFLFSPNSQHVAIFGRRGSDNKGGLFVDGKLVYEARSNFLIHHLAFTPDSQHLFWVAFEPPKDPTTSQGDEVTYLDGKPVTRTDYNVINFTPYQTQPRVEMGPNGVAQMEHTQGAEWQIGPDGVLTCLGPVGDVVKRFKITPASDTSVETLLSVAK